MKLIYLIETLSERDVALLAQIGIKNYGLLLEVPDDRYTYFKVRNGNYSIHCFDDDTPVATVVIQGEKYQRISVYPQAIKNALKRKLDYEDLPRGVYPSYEERIKLIDEGNYSFLFNIPFNELRFDEQELVKKYGYKNENMELYYPLSERGKKIIDLIKYTKRALEFTKYNPSLFGGRESARRQYFRKHATIWFSLLDGVHELTAGLSKAHISAYVVIALKGIAPGGFHELRAGNDPRAPMNMGMS